MLCAAHVRRALVSIAAVAILAVAACGADDTAIADLGDGGSSAGMDDGAVGDSGTDGGDVTPPDGCRSACGDLDTRLGIALCQACRCKAAFDDWLPPVDVLQCGNAVPIVTYTAALSDAGVSLERAGPAATRCVNPSLLTGSCRQGSRLGQIQHGDVALYWICRDPYLDPDGSVIYEDMAAVGHNLRTGATCFWDDVNDVMHDDDAPPFDLLEASAAERTRFVDRFAFTDGSGCVGCHDHDPFLYTPYLASTDWQSVAEDDSAYHLVTLGGAPRPTGVTHLVSELAEPCTRCHRLGSEGTCSQFVPDALGLQKRPTHESAVHDAVAGDNPHWSLAAWMPADADTGVGVDAWRRAFGAAGDHILQCCAAPGRSERGCRWAPVPASR